MFCKPFNNGKFRVTDYFATEDDWRRYELDHDKYLREWNERWERDHTPVKSNPFATILSIVVIVFSYIFIYVVSEL